MHQVLVHIVSKDGFLRSDLFRLPLSIGRCAENGCALTEFLETSAEHASLDYDMTTQSLVVTDRRSRNGTYLIDGDTERRIPEGESVSTGGREARFQIGTLKFVATLVDKPTPTVRRATAPVGGPTVPYKEQAQTQWADALERAVVAEMETAIENHARAREALVAALTSTQAIGTLCPSRHTELVREVVARHPELFSAAETGASPDGAPCLPAMIAAPPLPDVAMDTATVVDGFARRVTLDVAPPETTAERQRILDRAASVIEELVVQLPNARRAHASPDDLINSSDLDHEVRALRHYLFEKETSDDDARRMVVHYFDRISTSRAKARARHERTMQFILRELAPAALSARVRRRFDLFGKAWRRSYQETFARVAADDCVAILGRDADHAALPIASPEAVGRAPAPTAVSLDVEDQLSITDDLQGEAELTPT